MNREKVECEVEAILGNVPADVIDKVTTKILDRNINVDSKEFETVVKALSKNLTEGLKIKSLKLENDKFVADESQDDTVGEIKDDGTVIKEYYGQGLIYKNFKNFEQKSGPCYIAEYQGENGTGFHDNIVGDELKTKNFNDMVEGEDYETYDTIIKQVKDEYARRNLNASEQTIEDTAREIFYEVDWQYVSSLLDEWLDAEEEVYGEEQEELNEEINIPSKEDELDGCVKSEYAVNIYNKDRKTSFNKPEFNRQYDVYETYEDAVKTVKTKEFKDDLKDYETFDIVKIYYDEYGNELGVDTVDDEETLSEDNYKLENYKKADMSYITLTETKSVTNRARKLKLETKQNKKQLNAKNYKSNSVIFLDDEDGETEGSFDLDFDGVEFDNKEEFEEYCKENIINRLNVNLGDIDEDSLENAIQTLYIGHNHRITESVSQNITDEIYEAEDFTELLDILDGMEQDAKVQRARNLTSHAYTHTPDDEEDERLGEIKDEVVEILTESKEQLTPGALKDSIIKKAKELGLTVSKVDREWVIQDGDNAVLYITPRRMWGDTIDRLKLYTTDFASPKADEFIKALKVDGLLTESKTLDESLKDYGVKPSPEFLQSVIDKMVDNLGISKYEFKIEEDAIKFRYNGKVYFAEPVSMYQVDIFDDNHNKIGYGVGVNDIKEEVFTEYTNNDYLYELVGGEYAGTYTREEAEKLPIKEPELTDDLSDTRANGGFVHRKELDNQLQFKGYLGPMWNGTQDGKAVIRYETQEVYDMLSR